MSTVSGMAPAVRSFQTRRWLAVVAVAGLLGVMVVHVEGAIALLAPSTLGVLGLIVLVRTLIRWPDAEATRRILWWTVVAFAAHLVFGLFSTLVDQDIRFYLAADSFSYDAAANDIVQHWRAGLPFPTVSHGKEGFYYLLAALYWIFGSHMAAGLAVNAIFAAGLVPVLSDVTHRLFGPAAARYVAPLVVALPGLFLWTSQLMREAGMLFLLAVALNAAIRLVDRLSLSAFSVLIASLVLAFTFRAWVALVVAGALLAGFALGHRHVISGLGTGFGALVFAAVVMLASGLGYSGYQAAVSVDLNQANVVRKDLATAAQTGYGTEVDISTTRSALSYLPRGVLSFTLGPFPWNIRSARQLPFVPDMLAWWLLLPSLWRGYVASERIIGRRRLILILPAVAVILFMSLALGNFGIVVRERLQVVVLIVPFIALGLAERRSRREEQDPEPEEIVAGQLAVRA